MSPGKFIRLRWFLPVFAGMAMLVGSLSSQAMAQGQVSDAVLSQIHELQQEKDARTPAQQKMDSQLVYAVKMNRRQAITPSVPSLQTDVLKDTTGLVLVDIRAVVTNALLKQMNAVGVIIVNDFPQYGEIRARVPMNQLEIVAGMSGVQFVRPAVQFSLAHSARAMGLQDHSAGSGVSSGLRQFTHSPFEARATALQDGLPPLIASATKPAYHRNTRITGDAAGTIFDAEGDAAHNAAAARSAFGVDGTGVKVGVLSDSVDYLTDAQTAGALGNVTVLPGQSGESASGEGTAMLEIIHRLAPGASLYFATALGGPAAFAQNIRDLRTAGCDIIVDDFSYFNESPFQDGILTQAVNDVTASGALYFSSAGNAGSKDAGTSGTWEGDFADGGAATGPLAGDGEVHSFGAQNYDVVAPGGSDLRVDLFWSDPLGASSNDYDLYVLDTTGSTVLGSSTNIQNGTQDPYESVPTVAVGNQIVIVKKNSAQPRFLHLESGRGELTINTPGQTHGHSCAVAAYCVAAVDTHTTSPFPGSFLGGSANPAEWFSSDGPRRMFFKSDGTAFTPGNFSSTGGTVLQKPDVGAANGVTTSLPGDSGLNPFYGTSAAAPHAAAIAALLKSYRSSLTSVQIRSLLTATALDIMNPGVDRDSGTGIVMPYPAIQALTNSVSISGATLVAESCPPGNGVIDPGETVTVNFSLKNVGLSDTTNIVATLQATGGVTSPSAPQTYGALLAGGAGATKPFTFAATGPCGGTLTATLQLQDGSVNLGAVTQTFQLGKPLVAFSENFDSVTAPTLPAGWTVNYSSPNKVGGPWYTRNDFYDSTPNSAYSRDPADVSDNSLVSPAIPVTTAGARLTFRNYYDLEAGYDGGVLEISLDGGGTFTDMLAAGGSFLSGGYNGTISAGYGSPIAGRVAWTDNSGGFTTSIVNLPPAAAGKSIRLRWRTGTDNSDSGGGWLVDSVVLTDGFTCCAGSPADLSVTQSPSPNPAVIGRNLSYLLVVSNGGPAIATGVSVTDTLPAGVTFVSATSPQGTCTQSGGKVTCSLGSMTSGTTDTILVTVTTNLPGTLLNTAVVSAAQTDPNTNNNTSSSSIPSVPVPFDINTDGSIDLLLTNSQAQQAAFWYLNSGSLIGNAYASMGGSPITLPTGWKIVATGDFNRDGQPDLVLQNSNSSQIAFWFTSGATITGGAYATSAGSQITVPPGWQIVGAGDFNGDGSPDLVLQNTSTGLAAIWYMNGTNVTGGAYVFSGSGPISVPPGWKIVGAGDFNGDGRPDLILENTPSGQIAFWFTNVASVTGGVYATSGGGAISVPSGWQIAAVGDYNLDGSPDLALQNLSTGQLALWYTNGANITSGAYILSGGSPLILPSGWQVSGPH